MSSYKLTYFNARGRAELTRLIFVAADAKFEDERISDWPGTAQAESPLGQLPYLTVDGVKLPQSIAFARFVARQLNLAGSDDLEQAKADAVVDTLSDLQNAYVMKVFGASKEERDAVVVKFLAEDGANHLGKLEKIVSMYGNEGFSVGNSLKWSDLHIFNVTSIILDLDPNILEKCPKIKAIRKTVENNPKIATYIKNRPVTSF